MTAHAYPDRVTQPKTAIKSSGTAAVAILLMLVAFVACSDEKVAPETTAPPGFTVMSDAERGIAVAVPSEWTRIPLTINPAAFDKDANALRLANPKLASILTQARQLGQSGGTFMAVAPDGKVSANLSADKPKEKTLADIVTNSIAGLTDIGGSAFAQAPTTLAEQPAVKVTFKLDVSTDAGIVGTAQAQYYMLRDKTAYILTVADAAPEVADAIAASLRLR